MTILSLFAVIGTLFFIAERLAPAAPQPILRRGLFIDAIYVSVSIALRIALNGTLAIAVTRLAAARWPAYTGLLHDAPLWLQAVAIIAIIDFICYVMHRLKHRWSWWWRLHETHHSSQDLDWFSSVRFHPVEKVIDRMLYLVPLVLLGVSEQALLILAGLDAVIGSFSHANLDVRIGPLKYLFVGPEMHRWHHAKEGAHQRVNFGNNLSIFDWIFGTAYVSRDNPRDFGIADPDYPDSSFWKQFLYAFRRRT